MRLFIAVELPDDIKSQIQLLTQGLSAQLPEPGRACRWVKPEQYHLTLKFLGECRDSMLAPLKQTLDTVAHQHIPFELQLKKIGSFNQGKSLKVLWLGTDEGTEAVKALACDVQKSCEGIGFEAESGAYHPHITLARSKGAISRILLEKMSDDSKQKVFGPIAVHQIALVQSVLTPQGSNYTTLWRFPLASA